MDMRASETAMLRHCGLESRDMEREYINAEWIARSLYFTRLPWLGVARRGRELWASKLDSEQRSNAKGV